MVDDLPGPIVLDDPDFLGLVVVLLFLVHKMARIRKWFTIDSNFKRPILKRTDRAPTRQHYWTEPAGADFCKACSFDGQVGLDIAVSGLNALVIQGLH